MKPNNDGAAKTTALMIKEVTDSLNHLLQEKNLRYGNSALSPLNIFSKDDAITGIKIRMDDKLMRIKTSKELRKNDLVDYIGYGVLLCIANDWLNFDELID